MEMSVCLLFTSTWIFCLGEGVGAQRQGGDVSGALFIFSTINVLYSNREGASSAFRRPSEPLPCCGQPCCSCYERGCCSELYFRGSDMCFCCLSDFLSPLQLFGAEQYLHFSLTEELADIDILPETAFCCRVSPPAEENLKTPNWLVFASYRVSMRTYMIERAVWVILA